MIARTIEVDAEFTQNVIEADAELNDRIIEVEATLTTNIEYSEMPSYDGAVEVTPSAEAQVLETRNTALYQNITINPIPHNYGLISWSGLGIKVS